MNTISERRSTSSVRDTSATNEIDCSCEDEEREDEKTVGSAKTSETRGAHSELNKGEDERKRSTAPLTIHQESERGMMRQRAHCERE
jgi:hypothetical protein